MKWRPILKVAFLKKTFLALSFMEKNKKQKQKTYNISQDI